MSFEELRLYHYKLAAQGNEQQAIEAFQALVSNAESQMQNALSDLDGALQYVLEGEKQHPNRIDVIKTKGAAIDQVKPADPSQKTTSPFGAASNVALPLGQPSASSTFSVSSAPTFGQLSASKSVFGQPSVPAFGQPSFGQAATLDRPATSFGQPSSTFGKPSIATSTFGQSSAPYPFGASQKSSTSSGEASNPFQRSSTVQASSQPSIFGQSSGPAQGGPFARASPTIDANPFSQKPSAKSGGTTPQNSKASPSPFTPLTISDHAQSSTATSSPFAQQNGPPGSTATTSPFATRPSVIGQTSGTQLRKDSQGRLLTWNGKPVSYIDEEPCYRNSNGSWQRIWFPDGPPTFMNSASLPDEVYDDATKANYMYVKEKGAFKDGVMPLLPPKREWCDWTL